MIFDDSTNKNKTDENQYFDNDDTSATLTLYDDMTAFKDIALNNYDLGADELIDLENQRDKRQLLNLDSLKTRNYDPLNPPLKTDKAGELIKQFVSLEGFGYHHVDLFNEWVINTAFKTVRSKQLDLGEYLVRFDALYRFNPYYNRGTTKVLLTPKYARDQGLSYGSDWQVDIGLYHKSDLTKSVNQIKDVCIANIFTMLKSSGCILVDKSAEELELLGEDPFDPAGYFIIEGAERIILGQEQLAVDKMLLINLNNKAAPVVRMLVSTINGTSLVELILTGTDNSVLEMKLPSIRGKQMTDVKSINILKIFRLFALIEATKEIKDNDLLVLNSLDNIQNYIMQFIKPEQRKKSLLKLNLTAMLFEISQYDLNDFGVLMEKGKDIKATVEEVAEIFDRDLFPHLNEIQGPNNETIAQRRNRITKAKLNLLSIMSAKMLEHLAGFRKVDDRDSWSNKRIETGGRMMEALFRKAWRKTISEIQKEINDGKITSSPTSFPTIAKELATKGANIITKTFRDSFVTGNWGVAGLAIRSNVAPPLVRESLTATYAHVDTTDVKISRTDRQQSLRLPQNSQWGLIDPVTTPEGANCGLIKVKSITTKLSIERDDGPIIRFLIGDEGLQLKNYVSNNNNDEFRRDMIMVGAKFVGWCNADETQNDLILGRRGGQFPFDMSVVRKDNWLYIDISSSRPIRPVLIVNPESQINSKTNFLYIDDELNARKVTNYQMLTKGYIEYISAWEQEYLKIAVSVDELLKRRELFEERNSRLQADLAVLDLVNKGDEDVINQVYDQLDKLAKENASKLATVKLEVNNRVKLSQDLVNKLANNAAYTHCELDGTAILSPPSAIIPYPDHNQAPRNTYQAAMGKQALSKYHSNHLNRMGDGVAKILINPIRPCVETDMYSVYGLDERGSGEMIKVAFIAAPYTEEDSFIFKKEFVDNHALRFFKYFTYKTVINTNSNTAKESLERPIPHSGENGERYKYIQANGLPMIGAFLKAGDCVIGKVSHPSDKNSTRAPRNESKFLRYGDQGIIDKVHVTESNKKITIIVKLRIMRVPRPGDKYAPRNAQKATIGYIMPAINMPWSVKDGSSPDVITNPHNIPSRMTISYPMEIQASKAAALAGSHENATAFRAYKLSEDRKNGFDNFQYYRQVLTDYGYDQYGYETMRSGTSGKLLETEVFTGPVYLQALRHHVEDKIQSRGTGAVKPSTHHPPKGRGNRGGLRFGEMERDAAISHGASSFLRERLMLVSDAYTVAICQRCGDFAVNNPNHTDKSADYLNCSYCNGTLFGRVTIPYVFKLLIHWLASLGIRLRSEVINIAEFGEQLFNPKISMIDFDLEDDFDELELLEDEVGDEDAGQGEDDDGGDL